MNARSSQGQSSLRSIAYYSVWGVVGLCACLYVGNILLSEPVMMGGGESGQTGAASAAGANRALSKAMAQIRTTQDDVGQLVMDVSEIKSNIATLQEREKIMVGRVVMLEDRTGTSPQGALPIPAKAQDRVPGMPVPLRQPAGASLPGQPAAVHMSGAQRPITITNEITTGTILASSPQMPVASLALRQQAGAPAPAPTALTPPAIRAQQTRQAYGVLLSQGPSVEALRLSWTVLSEGNGELLQRLQPRYLRQGANRPDALLQLIAGPFSNEAEAAQLCAALQSRSVGCSPAIYRGDAL